MEHFKETDISGFYVGSNGTIINQTGIKLVKYRQSKEMYVGFEVNGKRIMKKLSHLVYQFHINRGRKIDDELTVSFKDFDVKNICSDNLTLRPKKNSKVVDTSYHPNKGLKREISSTSIVVYSNWMLNESSSKAG